ncbi:AAA family ATPase (plasmid) [Streptomyces sp. BI20]|uniref:AAA family ATPase n=1 Tax=Streptomyces sp. BI20 TaxID=3403460 RepID=UPI003C70D512
MFTVPLHLPAGVVVLVGPPASGKSTYAAYHPTTWRLSLDAYRGAATDSEADQSATPVAAQIQSLLLDARLSRALPVIVDSCNVHGHVRATLLARARYWQRPCVAILFDTPLNEVLARNAARPRVVPEHVIRDHHALLPTREQLLAEGFDAVHNGARIPALPAQTTPATRTRR